ncbi:MAG: hypothetical protein GC168_13325 [Candidatus Hydrogenedens sp.]|nr:hypothetical protein [Candidatus Hydrogenedens sp.]
MQRTGRYFFYVSIAALWLAVGALGLEFGERARAYLAEHAYAGYFEEQNSKVYRMVPADELQAAENQFALPDAPASAPAPASPAEHPGCPSDAEAATDREAFAAQGEEQREVIATMQGELYVDFDESRVPTRVWGDPLLVRKHRERCPHIDISPMFPELGDAIAAMKPGESAGPFRYDLNEGMYRLPLQGTARRDADGTYHAEIRNVAPRIEPTEPTGPDAAYDIINIRYKRNWCPENPFACYNNYGFRDEDVVLPKPEGLYRVVCIGGSTTEEGNNDADTYPNIMERKLQAALGKDRIEVINAGICGIDSYFELRRMEDYLELQPDLIVYYNGINDFTHAHIGDWLSEQREQAAWIRKSKLLTRLLNRQLLPPEAALRDAMWKTTFLNLRAMAYRAQECGVEFAVCSFAVPNPELLSYRDWNFLDLNLREVWHGEDLTYRTFTRVAALHNELVRRLCSENNLDYIPVAENLDAGLEHFFDTCHMTPLGLELKTNIIGAYVEQIARKNIGVSAGR